ncbi:MAG TPA: beta-phosphoglucomutase family hydrolase [Terriglobales bacterium]|nr:beta-phosphoglucomutase family hydrolase [Terriglobales bacterium]
MPENMRSESVTISRRDFDAAIFDLDGVLTSTAGIHADAWKVVFDALLQKWARRSGQTFQPFDIVADYLEYVDGRPREDGIRSFLSARGISLPEGSEHDPEDADTVYALGERKTRLFLQALKKGIDPATGVKSLLRKLRRADIKTALGSSSKNTAAILHAAGLKDYFDACVDGVDAETLKLPGKPDPALFLEIARRLGVQPLRAIVFEDALAGVEAGKRGHFGRVVGIDRGQQSMALHRHGADVVIKSLQDVYVKEA